jgi:hypothetical protein
MTGFAHLPERHTGRRGGVAVAVAVLKARGLVWSVARALTSSDAACGLPVATARQIERSTSSICTGFGPSNSTPDRHHYAYASLAFVHLPAVRLGMETSNTSRIPPADTESAPCWPLSVGYPESINRIYLLVAVSWLACGTRLLRCAVVAPSSAL